MYVSSLYFLLGLLSIWAAQSMSSEEDHLQNLEARNATLEKDVKQYLERRDIERQVGCLPHVYVRNFYSLLMI